MATDLATLRARIAAASKAVATKTENVITGVLTASRDAAVEKVLTGADALVAALTAEEPAPAPTAKPAPAASGPTPAAPAAAEPPKKS